jgi:ribosome-associated translation inhibitor RaiA
MDRLLEPLGARRPRLALSVQKLERPTNEYSVRAVLRIPTGVLVAEHGEADPVRALAAAAEALGREVRQNRQELHRDHIVRFKARHREALNAAVSYLARDVELGRRQAFFELLRPMLGFLRQHAQWELDVMQADGTVPRGRVTVDDLIDDVLVMAWEHVRRRPSGKPLDLWLLDLLHEVTGRWSKESPHLSLEDRTEPEPERSPEDEPGE